MKRCSKCGEEKPLDDFARAKAKPDGRHGWCKSCQSAGQKAHRSANPEHYARKDRRKKLSTYNISQEEYDAILAAQGGRCGVCGRRPTGSRRLAVDHEHRTGVVRGLICAVRCNYQLLGQFHDDAKLFRGAADYLDNPPAIAVIGVRQVQGAPPLQSVRSTDPSHGE